MTSKLDEVVAASLSNPESFWGQAADAVQWVRRWNKVLDEDAAPVYRWFSGAEINTCYNAVDLHVESGRGDQAAIIYDSPVTDTIRTYTYAELLPIAGFARVIGSSSTCR